MGDWVSYSIFLLNSPETQPQTELSEGELCLLPKPEGWKASELKDGELGTLARQIQSFCKFLFLPAQNIDLPFLRETQSGYSICNHHIPLCTGKDVKTRG